MRGDLDPARHASLVQYLHNKRHFSREADLTGGAVLQRGVDWLQENHDEGPFLLWLESFDPHEPWDPPAGVRQPLLRLPAGAARAWSSSTPRGGADRHARGAGAHQGPLLRRDHLHGRHASGRLLNTLADLGRLEDTVVMVTCDHGTELLDHGRFGKSADHLYAHNTQLNWIVRLPDGHPQAQGGPGADDRRLRPEPRPRPHRA